MIASILAKRLTSIIILMLTSDAESWMQKWTLGEKNRHPLVLANRPRFFTNLLHSTKGSLLESLYETNI